MKTMYTYGKETVIKSIKVYSGNPYFNFTEQIEDFLETDKGRWVKNNAVSIHKMFTYSDDGDKTINLVALFAEPKYNFFILKWC